jgi:hypothetical protein
MGLDSPKLGSISPTFDLTIPLNSLWLIEVLYYNPRFGGMLFINIPALLDFIKILYLDRRISFFLNYMIYLTTLFLITGSPGLFFLK